jgi:hypothetical protein
MSRYATPTDLIPEPCAVMGTALKPFSLGHHLLLQKVESRFTDFLFDWHKPDQREAAILAARSASADELAIAVFICAASYRDTLAAINDGEWSSSFDAWLKKLKPRWYNRTPFNHNAQAEAFAEYISLGYSRPPVHRHESAYGISLSSPWELLLKCRLVRAGFSEIDVLEKYLPAAWYEYFTLIEIQQSETCLQVKNWKNVFWTKQDQDNYSRH